MNSKQFPDYVYSTPEEWGSYTVYADADGMTEQIDSLKDSGGSEWDGIDISDCQEYILIAQCNNGSAAYRTTRTRDDHDVYVFRREDEKATYFTLDVIYNDKFDGDELAALGVNL
jgi:hypothetical protein